MRSKYDTSYCQQLIEHMSEGLSFKSFAGKIKVNRSTLYDWVDQHEDFSHAKAIALEACRIYWEKLGIDMCKGVARGNATTFVWMTKNILGWTDAGINGDSNHAPINIQIVKDNGTNEAS